LTVLADVSHTVCPNLMYPLVKLYW